jgi:hydrogenase 3 maturation protease
MTTTRPERVLERVARAGAVDEFDCARLLRGRVCILGIGNRERGDDGVGSLLAESLQGESTAVVIDAGAVPENHLGKVLRAAPDTILLVDAIDFGGAPGAVARIDRDRLGEVGLSTHAVSLGMAVDYLSRQTDAEVIVIGIQPAQLEPGAPVSAAVARGLARLRRQLLGCLAPGPEPTEIQHADR